MTTSAVRAQVSTAIVLLLGLLSGPPIVAQAPIRVTIPGTAFTAEGRGDDVRVDNVAGGRRFRGKGFAKVIVRATLSIPAPNLADAKMQRLVVHFRTSASGPSLRSVELRNGSQSAFRLETHLAGDYTTRETTQPASMANAWAFDRVPVRVYAQSVVRLEIQFPGGFDSQINPGEFVVTGMVVDFPRKAAPLPETLPSSPQGPKVGSGWVFKTVFAGG